MQQAVCVRRKKKRKKNPRNLAAPKTHHEIHSSPATATTSRRRAMKHVPRAALAISKNHECYILRIYRQTDEQNNGALYTPRYEEAFALKEKNGLGRFAPSALPHYEEAFLPYRQKNGLRRFAPLAMPHYDQVLYTIIK